MARLDVARHRLQNQRIGDTAFVKPGDVVRWLGAVQAQDYLASLWAIGIRLKDATEAGIERAIADRTIVRTWPMRGTLHFVAAEDVRWMLQLLTPRVLANTEWRLRQLEIDEAVLARCKELLGRALSGGKQRSRSALYGILDAAGIATAGGRGLHLLGHLAQEAMICFGAREGKQPTFALLDEWAPQARTMERDEALAELARRYFTSHGPATLHDFAWWSGLTTADARAGIEMAGAHLQQDLVDGQAFWLSASAPTATAASLAAYLLPAFDEYTVAYKDRRAVLDPSYASRAHSGGMFYPMLVIDGQVTGTWKRTLKRGSVLITSSPFRPLETAEKHAFTTAASQYGVFLELPVVPA